MILSKSEYIYNKKLNYKIVRLKKRLGSKRVYTTQQRTICRCFRKIKGV